MYQIRSFIKNYPGIVPPITNYQQDLHFVSDAYRFSCFLGYEVESYPEWHITPFEANNTTFIQERRFLMLSKIYDHPWMLETINGIELRRNSCNFSLSIRPSRFYHLPSVCVFSFSDLFSFLFIVRLFMEIDVLSL